ncbi:MAG: hypothetical protein GY866_33150, partial [Proteobacteria bacterium]|nr:hypothetical protein [Pseudomonadota bacterium]
KPDAKTPKPGYKEPAPDAKMPKSLVLDKNIALRLYRWSRGEEEKGKAETHPYDVLQEELREETKKVVAPVVKFHDELGAILRERSYILDSSKVDEVVEEIENRDEVRFSTREGELKNDPILQKIKEQLHKHIRAIFGLDEKAEKKELSDEEFQDAGKSLRKDCLELAEKSIGPRYEKELHRLAYEPTLWNENQYNRTITLALILRFVEAVVEFYTNPGKKPESKDERIAAELRTARWIRMFAQAMGWEEVVALTYKALFTEKEKLAFLGPWIEAPNYSLGTLKADFPEGIDEFAPLGIGDIVGLIILYKKRLLTQTLEAFLSGAPYIEAEEGKIIEKNKFLFRRVKEKIARTGDPIRYIIKDFEHSFKVDDFYEPENLNFSMLIETHEQTAILRDKLKKKDKTLIYPTVGPSDARMVPFVWGMPNISEIFRPFLSNKNLIEKFNDTPDLVKDGKRTVLTLEDLQEILYSVDNGRHQDVVADILTEESRAQEDMLNKQQRRAWTQTRRLMANLEFLPGLEKYKGEENGIYVDGGKTLNEILNRINEFSKGVRPRQDMLQQTGMLILEIVTELKPILQGVNFRFVKDYLGYLEAALFIAYDASEAERFLQNDQKPADKWLKDRKASLVWIVKYLQKKRREAQAITGIQGKKDEFIKGVNFTVKLTLDDDSFTVGGQDYKITKVHTDFMYSPPFGQKNKKDPFSSYAPPHLSSFDGKAYHYGDRPVKLFDVKIGNESKTISYDDTNDNNLFTTVESMKEMERVIVWQSFSKSMKNIQASAEILLDLLLDFASMFPPTAAVATAAQVAKAIHDVLTERDGISKLVDFFQKGPKEIFTQLLNDLDRILDPDELWDFLLFDGKSFENLKKEPAPAKNKPRGSGKGAFAKVGRSMGHLAKTAQRVANGFIGLQGRMSNEFSGFRSSVLGRP